MECSSRHVDTKRPRQSSLRHSLVNNDRDAVRQIVESTGFFTAEETDVAVELVDERLRRGDASGYHFVLAELNTRVVGFAAYGPIPCTIGSFDLYWIVVDPRWQNQGIGRLLLGEVHRHVRERGGRYLYADTSGRAQYAPTRAFYQRSGFEIVAVLADFYNLADDKIIFRKSLAADGGL